MSWLRQRGERLRTGSNSCGHLGLEPSWHEPRDARGETLKTLHGNYIQIDDETYLLAWVAADTKQQIDHTQPRFNLVRRAVGCLIRIAVHLSETVDNDTSTFQHIVIANYRDIALGLSNALTLLRIGSLADGLTLLRPALEYMLDIAYLRTRPCEVESYERKIAEHNATLVDGKPAARDPTLRLRFINFKTMTKKIQTSTEYTDVDKEMVTQYNLLSNVVEHTSPERKVLSLRRPEDWENALGQFVLAVFFAVNQIHGVDADLTAIIKQNCALSSEFDEIRETLNHTMEYDVE